MNSTTQVYINFRLLNKTNEIEQVKHTIDMDTSIMLASICATNAQLLS